MTKNKKKLYIIDLSSFIFRAFYAIRPLSSPSGTPVNALYGVANMLLKLVESEKIEHLVLARDIKGPSFRLDIDPNYKANRGAPPEDLVPQFELIDKLTTLLSFPKLQQSPYEADDIIGSVVRQYEDKYDQIMIVSSDKDLMQFINDKVFMFDTMKNILIDSEEVEKKMGVPPHQIVDYLSLIGDTSDNIPGVRGIGPKGASKLLKEFETLEGIYENVEKITAKKTHNSLKENKENAFMSKKLVTIVQDIDLGVDESHFDYKFVPSVELVNFLADMGFQSIIKKLNLNEHGEVNSSAPKEEREVKFEEYQTIDELFNSLQFYEKESVVSTDFEEVDGKYYFAINSTEGKIHLIQLNKTELTKLYTKLFESNISQIICFGGKKIYKLFKEVPLNWVRKIFDIELGENLLNQIDKINFPYLVHKYAVTHSFLDDGFTNNAKLTFAEDEKIYAKKSYACFQVYPQLFRLLKEEKLLMLFDECDRIVDSILAKMEVKGIHLDKNYFQELTDRFEKEKEGIKSKIINEAGEEFNLNSPKQVSHVLFEKLQLPVIKKTKTGYSTNVQVLEELEAMGVSEVPRLLLSYRELEKLLSTYVKALPTLINEKTSTLHTSFKQTGTATGRLSSENPNLQNIPIRTENGRLLRKGFLPDQGHYLLAADYSQIELRLLAHFSQDPVMVDSFIHDKDIHAQTAAEVFQMDIDKVDSEKRSFAKAINFGLMYGQSSFGLSQMLKISQKDARDYISQYFQRFGKIKSFLDKLKEDCEEKGYSETILGRKRFIPDINSKNRQVKSMAERMAINSPIQGSAADLIKMAMVNLDYEITRQKMKSSILLQVHDELILDVPEEELDVMSIMLKDIMEEVFTLSVPLKVSVSHGRNWYDLK